MSAAWAWAALVSEEFAVSGLQPALFRSTLTSLMTSAWYCCVWLPPEGGVVGAVLGVVGAVVGVVGTVLGVVGAVVGVVGTVLGVVGAVLGVVGAVLGVVGAVLGVVGAAVGRRCQGPCPLCQCLLGVLPMAGPVVDTAGADSASSRVEVKAIAVEAAACPVWSADLLPTMGPNTNAAPAALTTTVETPMARIGRDFL